jgi:hypothetical protein
MCRPIVLDCYLDWDKFFIRFVRTCVPSITHAGRKNTFDPGITCTEIVKLGNGRTEYIASYKHMMWRVPVSVERRDAFRRFNAVGTETPSRFGGRCYGRTTNPARRFEEHFQYGSDVRLAKRRTSVLRLMRTRRSESSSNAALGDFPYVHNRLINPNNDNVTQSIIL